MCCPEHVLLGSFWTPHSYTVKEKETYVERWWDNCLTYTEKQYHAGKNSWPPQDLGVVVQLHSVW